ncbi:MAG: hypothetical protein LBU30_00420, partial [Candidatus Methanoplasma sp.]|nr:hypothetical protein [Candidatus Methanoplasma sp.]
MIVKDVQTRLGPHDPAILENVSKFLMHNIGNEVSSNSVSKSTGISPVTVRNYLRAMEGAYLLYRAYRYDIIGKRLLRTREKYHVPDTGIRNSVLGNAKGTDMSRQIENIVYLELRRRGFTVNVGNYRDWEVDFTASKRGVTEHYQVTQTMRPESSFEREVRPLA